MASLQPHLEILETSHFTPSPSLPQLSLPFTYFDNAWIYAGAVDRIFFFPFPCTASHFTSQILPHLKSSLSQALHLFPPLCGKIRPAPHTDHKFELSYVPGEDSVPFVVARLDGEDFEELSGHQSRNVSRILRLRPQLAPEPNYEAKPVLAIQVTLFPNQGIAIGVAVHHAACDGHSSIQFVSTWASLCRSTSLTPIQLLFDRTLVSDPRGLSSVFLDDWRSFIKKTEHVGKRGQPNPDTMVSRTFSLSAAQIEKLKETVKSRVNDSSFRCSTVVVTYALAWVCMVKARRFSSDRTAYFSFAANFSEVHQPSIPTTYFGNRVGCIHLHAQAGKLMQGQGLVEASKIISKGIQDFKADSLMGSAERWIGRWLDLQFGQQPFSVAGSPQLKVYAVDFGWGKPSKVEVTSIMGSGAMSLAESTSEFGGVEIGLILEPDEMVRFATHFSGGLEFLLVGN